MAARVVATIEERLAIVLKVAAETSQHQCPTATA